MAEQAITITKGEHILNNLGVLNNNMAGITGRVVDPILLKHWRSHTQQNLKPYPPVPPASTYQRTKELFRSWDVLSDRRAATVTTAAGTTSNVDYADEVVGDSQAWWHARTGWIKLSDHEEPLLKSSVPIAARGYESEIFRFLTKRGLI